MSTYKKSHRKLEVTTAGFIIAVLLIAGLQTLKLNKAENQKQNIPNIAQPTDNAPTELPLKFKNTQIGLEFNYPKDWLVQEKYVNQANINDGIYITVKSPKGLVVNINGHYTGTQPGSCDKDIYDKPHITSSCSTLEVIGKEFLPVKTPEGDVFLVAAKFTPPSSTSSQYLLFLSSDPNVTLSQNPLVGTWPNYGVINTGKIYFDTFLSGIDNSNPGYYRFPEMITANEILKTVNLF